MAWWADQVARSAQAMDSPATSADTLGPSCTTKAPERRHRPAQRLEASHGHGQLSGAAGGDEGELDRRRARHVAALGLDIDGVGGCGGDPGDLQGGDELAAGGDDQADGADGLWSQRHPDKCGIGLTRWRRRRWWYRPPTMQPDPHQQHGSTQASEEPETDVVEKAEGLHLFTLCRLCASPHRCADS